MITDGCKSELTSSLSDVSFAQAARNDLTCLSVEAVAPCCCWWPFSLLLLLLVVVVVVGWGDTLQGWCAVSASDLTPEEVEVVVTELTVGEAVAGAADMASKQGETLPLFSLEFEQEFCSNSIFTSARCPCGGRRGSGSI